MVGDCFLTIVLCIMTIKICYDIYGIIISKKTINQDKESVIDKDVNILILIPVLREQKVIKRTLSHFSTLSINTITLRVVIVGTSRENVSKNKNYLCTGGVVENWIRNNEDILEDGISFEYIEIDEERGDRASQLNYGVKSISEKFCPDIIGVYDADSLPDKHTLEEVAATFCKYPYAVLQQPVHFIVAANRMAEEKKNPILVANALYQTDWTIIRELPRWSMHFQHCVHKKGKIYSRNDYLIGHGEFIPYSIYKKYEFPELEITDGIQLGYRLSMSGEMIKPLSSFCVDDVPQELNQLIQQHKRWFGGCNRLSSAYQWCVLKIGRASVLQLIDGFWSQISWAYGSIFTVIALIVSSCEAFMGNGVFLLLLIMLICLYCYIIPILAIKVTGVKTRIRFFDWLCLPLAVILKSIGPNLYLFQKLLSLVTGKEITYRKVER